MPTDQPRPTRAGLFVEPPPHSRSPADSAPALDRQPFPATASPQSTPLPVRAAGYSILPRARFAWFHPESPRAADRDSAPRAPAILAALSSPAAATAS